MMNIPNNIICVLDQLCNNGWSPVNVLKQFKVNFGLRNDNTYNIVTPALQTPTVVIIWTGFLVLIHVYYCINVHFSENLIFTCEDNFDIFTCEGINNVICANQVYQV